MSKNQKTQQTNTAQKATKAQKPKEHKQKPFNAAQLRSAPETLNSEDVLQAQKMLGNETVQRSLSAGRKDATATDELGYLNSEISGAIQKKRGVGNVLPSAIKEEAKQKLGHDFDDVRIHTDTAADQISSKINAKAFTIGKDIFFKKDAYAPGSEKGRETLLHEMTHVVQQSGAAPTNGKLKLGAPDTTHEKEAESLSKNSTQATDTMPVAGNASNTTVQREDEDDKVGLEIEQPETKEQEDDDGLIKEENLQEIIADQIGVKPPELSKTEKFKNWAGDSWNKTKKWAGDSWGKTKKWAGDSWGKTKKWAGDSWNKTKNFVSPAKDEKKEAHKNKLLETIKDTSKSEQEVAEARSQLSDLHGSKWNDVKSVFGYDQDSSAMSDRKSALKKSAAHGEEGAYEKYKAHQKAHPTKWQSVKNFASDTGSSIGSFFKDTFTKDNLGKGFNAIKGLFGGSKKKKLPLPKA